MAQIISKKLFYFSVVANIIYIITKSLSWNFCGFNFLSKNNFNVLGLIQWHVEFTNGFFQTPTLYFCVCWSSSIHNQCHSNVVDVMTSNSMGNVNSMVHPMCESNPMDDLNVELYTHITWCMFLSHFWKSLGTLTSLFKFSQNTSLCTPPTMLVLDLYVLVTRCHTTSHSCVPLTPLVLDLYVWLHAVIQHLIHELHQP
jgi:hypothetical protein